MPTSGRIHGEFLRLLSFLSDKQVDDYFAALGCGAGKYAVSAGSVFCTICPAGKTSAAGSVSENDCNMTATAPPRSF